MLVPDREVAGAYFVRVDGTDQSFVDPADPFPDGFTVGDIWA